MCADVNRTRSWAVVSTLFYTDKLIETYHVFSVPAGPNAWVDVPNTYLSAKFEFKRCVFGHSVN